jgi:hypothetical protein
MNKLMYIKIYIERSNIVINIIVTIRLFYMT